MMISKLIRSHIHRSSTNIYVRSITVRSEQTREEVTKHNVVKTEPGLKSWKDIPGPTSLPFIGPLHNYLPGGKLFNLDRREFTNRLHQIYGPIVKLDKIFKYPSMIFLYDADAVGTVLNGETSMPYRPTLKSLEEYVPKHHDKALKILANSQGNEWKNHRSKVSDIMLDSKSIAAAHTEQIIEVAMDLIKRLKNQRNEKCMMQDFTTDIRLWALDILAVVILGYRLNCFNPNLHENLHEKRFNALNFKLFEIIENIDLKTNVWQFFNFENITTVKKILNEIDGSMNFFIHKSREKWNTLERKPEEKKCLLEKLLEKDEITALATVKESLTTGNMISNTVISTLYLLGVNPDKQALLREEISSGKTRGRYLKACLKESLRILPPIFGNGRITTRSYNVLGYNISPGIPIVFMHENMSMMESYFLRPEEYIPERWLVDKTDPLYHGKATQYAALPFGHGVRSCLGRRISELSIETLIAKMVEHFDISWEGPPPELKSAVITYMKPPLKFVFKCIK